VYRYKAWCTKIMSAADDDSDDESYRDDQSECPSDASDLSIELLDDPAGNLDDLSAFVDHSEEESVVDDDQWRAVPFSGEVELHYDDVDETLMEKMKSQIKFIKNKVDDAMKNFHEDDLQRMSEYTQL